MSEQLIVVVSGKKQAGKSSAGKHILARYMNKRLGTARFVLNKRGDILDTLNNQKALRVDVPSDESEALYKAFGAKLYSFADPLKDFVHNTFGVDLDLMYGSDSDKNTKTHILWDDMPPHIRSKYSKPKRGSEDYAQASGPMTIREVLQVFGSDICRTLDANCWARSLYNKISNEKHKIAIVTDARFPNEISMGTERGAKVIRLLKKLPVDGVEHPSEVALDDFALGEYTKVIDNSQMSITDKNLEIDKVLPDWFSQYRI